jgi:hypothetical protein
MRSSFFSFTSYVFVSTCLVALAQSVPLVPFKNAPTVLARSTWKREVVPKDRVTMSYSPGDVSSLNSCLGLISGNLQSIHAIRLQPLPSALTRIFLFYSLKTLNSSSTQLFVRQRNRTTLSLESLLSLRIATPRLSRPGHPCLNSCWLPLTRAAIPATGEPPGCKSPPLLLSLRLRFLTRVSSVTAESFNSGIVLQVTTVPLREAGSSFRITHAAGTSDDYSVVPQPNIQRSRCLQRLGVQQ